MSDYLRLIYRRALMQGDPALVQVAFSSGVLDRYRQDAAFSVVRTDTVGRVNKTGGWSIDFGIAPGDAAIHASWQALTPALPDADREHWAGHASPLAGASEMFLKMQLSPGSCFDDGELRPW